MNNMLHKRCGVGKVFKHYRLGHGSVPCRPLLILMLVFFTCFCSIWLFSYLFYLPTGFPPLRSLPTYFLPFGYISTRLFVLTVVFFPVFPHHGRLPTCFSSSLLSSFSLFIILSSHRFFLLLVISRPVVLPFWYSPYLFPSSWPSSHLFFLLLVVFPHAFPPPGRLPTSFSSSCLSSYLFFLLLVVSRPQKTEDYRQEDEAVVEAEHTDHPEDLAGVDEDDISMTTFTLKKEMKTCDLEVASRESANRLEKPPGRKHAVLEILENLPSTVLKINCVSWHAISFYRPFITAGAMFSMM